MEMDEDDLIGEEQVIQQTQDEIDSPDPFLPMDEDAEDDGDSSSSSEDGDWIFNFIFVIYFLIIQFYFL